MDDRRERFDRDGFVVERGFLTERGVLELRAAIETAPERDDAPNPLSVDTMRFASNLFYGSAGLQAFLSSDDVVALTTSLLGPDLWVRWDQAVWKGAGAPAFPWHQDNGYTGLDATHLQIWVAVTAMDEANGGLVVAPGGHRAARSHRWRGGHVETDPPDRQFAVAAAPGDVIAFSSWLPHSTTPNRTGADRLAYVAEYLPLGVADDSVRPPHFVAAIDGRPAGEWRDLRSRWSPMRAGGPGTPRQHPSAR